MQKTLLTTVISIAIFSSVNTVFAQGTLLNDSLSSSSDIKINIDNVIEGAGRYGGIGASTGNKADVFLTNGSTLSIFSPSPIPGDAQRLYGLASQSDGAINVESEKNIINLVATSQDTRAVRGNGGNIFLSGGVEVNLSSESGSLTGIEGWNNSIVNLNGKKIAPAGNIKISLSSETGDVRGVGSNSGAEVVLSGGNFDLSGTSETGEAYGFSLFEGNSINLNFNTIKISTQIGETGTRINTGVYAHSGNVVLDGNTTIEVLGGKYWNLGVNTEGDKGDQSNSQIDFKGNQTSIRVEGNGETVALRPSGPKSQINISSQSVNISTNSTDTAPSTGIYVQYGGQANLTNPEADITISSKAPKGTATALLNSTYGGSNSFQFGTINISSSSLSLTAEGAEATGIMSMVFPGDPIHIADLKDGIFIDAETNINVTSTAENGTATAISLNNTKYDQSALDPVAKVDIANFTAIVTAKNGGNAYGINM